MYMVISPVSKWVADWMAQMVTAIEASAYDGVKTMVDGNYNEVNIWIGTYDRETG